MKTSISSLIALAAGLQQVSATVCAALTTRLAMCANQNPQGWLDAAAFHSPSNTDNTCNSQQSSGFDWSTLATGSFSSFGGIDFSGFTCSNSFSKRDEIFGRDFQVCRHMIRHRTLLIPSRASALLVPLHQMPPSALRSPATPVLRRSRRCPSRICKSPSSLTAIWSSTSAWTTDRPASRPHPARPLAPPSRTPSAVELRT